MKLIIGVFAIGILSSSVLGHASPKLSWFLFDENKKVWCGYADESAFQDRADKEKPLESARVRLVSGAPSEITYQVQPESGDWVVADRYSFMPGRISLKRATIYAQSGVQVVQQASIHGGVPTKFRLVSVKNVDGTATTTKGIDFPPVPIKTSVKQFRFLSVAQSIAKGSAPILCGSPGKP